MRILRRLAPPFPETQFWVVVAGVRYRLDFAYPALKKGVEAQSHRHHVLPRDFERNVRKLEALRRAGWEICTVTAKMVKEEPAATEALLREFLHGAPPLPL